MPYDKRMRSLLWRRRRFCVGALAKPAPIGPTSHPFEGKRRLAQTAGKGKSARHRSINTRLSDGCGEQVVPVRVAPTQTIKRKKEEQPKRPCRKRNCTYADHKQIINRLRISDSSKASAASSRRSDQGATASRVTAHRRKNIQPSRRNPRLDKEVRRELTPGSLISRAVQAIERRVARVSSAPEAAVRRRSGAHHVVVWHRNSRKY